MKNFKVQMQFPNGSIFKTVMSAANVSEAIKLTVEGLKHDYGQVTTWIDNPTKLIVQEEK